MSEESLFQKLVGKWMEKTFHHLLYRNRIERGDRLLEEVLELLQSHDYPPERVTTLVEYVYNRPKGDPKQEVGGVMITLAGYCHVADLDMHHLGWQELIRIMQPEVMEKIRKKQAAKNEIFDDSPLPGRTDN
jgi:hypothetical protein